MLQELAEHLIGKGIGGIYLCGSTGEGLWMSVSERQKTLETVLKQARGRVPVITHVGSVATRDSVILAEHARSVGAAGISSVLPPLRSASESIYLHYEAIAQAAPDMPFLPYLFGAQTDAVTLLANLMERIPNLAGAKYTGPDMFELWQLTELGNEGWTIFSGMDEECVFAAMSGSPANIGSTLNVMPGVYREIRDSCDAGDLARAHELQVKANRLTRILISFGFSGALREAMRMLGFDCGDPRPPSTALPESRRESFRDAVQGVGLESLAAL
jgi:N-acetylneuraminate lyase